MPRTLAKWSAKESRKVRASELGLALTDDLDRPIGVAEYQLVEALPKELETSLPSIEQIERELGEI